MALKRFRKPNSDSGTYAKNNEEIMAEILAGLPAADREAILSFYVDGKTEHEIEAALGIYVRHLRELRRSIRATFFAMRKRRVVRNQRD